MSNNYNTNNGFRLNILPFFIEESSDITKEAIKQAKDIISYDYSKHLQISEPKVLINTSTLNKDIDNYIETKTREVMNSYMSLVIKGRRKGYTDLMMRYISENKEVVGTIKNRNGSISIITKSK